ncbi:uncharacterized protein MELLADRAFT_71747 [Melampsora larici-populina 98AG31]|uniref:Uncharacterized protein n=1 Tax=Melampsora larici-populina (strain 98AG31 / pathotype 3-4-7) TaxID=747676 RepID=F4RK29_MELLP|nr:uncharacterized protein MELLADRAFT_71747 [Melampsora larici-populina 98AG31]EGG07029.1 hypothetical protein MELLADRAFT_71747 [Melampsora larici-populina 98AG31]
MKNILKQIIPKHSIYVKKISSRVPESEIQKSEALWDINPYEDENGIQSLSPDTYFYSKS